MATKWFRDGSWWAAVAGGAIAFTIAVLLHELGHFLGYTVRARAVVPTLLGALAVGGPIWVLWLGPLVLP